MTLEARLETAAAKLGLREPFIAAVMSQVPRQVSDTVPTAGTNGSWTRFNPAFCDPLPDEELFGLYLHEALHVILRHMWRRGGREPRTWNFANDAIINRYIKQRGYSLPDGGVFLDWVTDEMDSEEVYAKLMEQRRGGGGGKKGKKGEKGGRADDPNDAGGFDGEGDLHDADDAALAREQHVEASILAAAKMARDCGQGSALIDRILGTIGAPKISWQDLLRNMVSESARTDYTFARPSRRFIGRGMYLPSLHAPAIGGLCIGWDTSGSMGEEQANQIAAELHAIVADTQPAFVEVVYCDYSVTRVEHFERDEDLVLKPAGGGGTRFQPVFEHAATSGKHYCGMVFFTDLEGNLSECIEPEFPVIWVNIGSRDHQHPFGDYARLAM